MTEAKKNGLVIKTTELESRLEEQSMLAVVLATAVGTFAVSGAHALSDDGQPTPRPSCKILEW